MRNELKDLEFYQPTDSEQTLQVFWEDQPVAGWRVILQGLNPCKPDPSLTHLISNYITELILA